MEDTEWKRKDKCAREPLGVHKCDVHAVNQVSICIIHTKDSGGLRVLKKTHAAGLQAQCICLIKAL